MTPSNEWVALTTCVEEASGVFHETGTIHMWEPWGDPTRHRLLVPGEPEAICLRCGDRFAATDDRTADANRDQHLTNRDPRAMCPYPQTAQEAP